MPQTITIGFGGKKSELFNAARKALLEMSPPASINGNALRGQIVLNGAIPLSDERVIVDYTVNDGYVDLTTKNHIPSAIMDELQQAAKDWLPPGQFDPVEHGPLPSSILIAPLPVITKTVGKKPKNESKQLSVIEGDAKPNRNAFIVASIVAAAGALMIFIGKNMKPKQTEAED